MPGRVSFVGPATTQRPDPTPFPWEHLDGDDPAVLVSLGTVNAEAGERFFRAAIEALAERPVRGVVVAPPDAVGAVPSNVVVQRRVPQLALLPHLSAVVTHGGHNTVCEALAHGLPLVVAPIRDDQPVIAAQVVAAGAGVRVRFGRPSPAVLGEAVDRVLHDPQLRAGAEVIATSFAMAGGAPAAAAELEALASGGRRRRPPTAPSSTSAPTPSSSTSAPTSSTSRRRRPAPPPPPPSDREVPPCPPPPSSPVAPAGPGPSAPSRPPAWSPTALRLRRRASVLPKVVPSGGVEVDQAAWRAVAVPGAQLDREAVDAVARWAETNGLDAVDVVPADLPVERALDLLRQVDASTYRTNPLLEGRTAGHAVVIREEVAKRADLPDREVTPAEMIEIARQVKRFAPRTSTVAVVPGTRAIAEDLTERRAVQKAMWDRYSSLVIVIPAAQLAALGLGGGAGPRVGWARPRRLPGPARPRARRHRQRPRPRDLASHSPRRWIDEVVRLVGTARADAPPAFTERTAEDLRPAYDAELAEGVERFLEPRRDTCPWCEGDVAHAEGRVTRPDPAQAGRVPRSTSAATAATSSRTRGSRIEGLDFYYHDFYDGLGGERAGARSSRPSDEHVPGAGRHGRRPGRRAAALARRRHRPRPLLPGRPGALARDHLRRARHASSIEEAADRGWVDAGYRGLFPELAPDLRRSLRRRQHAPLPRAHPRAARRARRGGDGARSPAGT